MNLFKKDPRIEVVKEPVVKWRDVNGTNLLRLMYENGPRWNFAFQSRVQQTMLEGHQRTTHKPVKIMERSLHSTHEIFMKHQVRFNKIQKVEADILESWYTFLTTNNAYNTDVDLYIYLKTSPEVAFERLEQRNRKEEQMVTLDYIRQIHFLHEEWLGDSAQPKSTPVLILDGNKNEDKIKEMVSRVDDVITGYRRLNDMEIMNVV